MTNQEEKLREGSIADFRIQIMKAFEVMDVSQFNGKNVFEAGNYDTMCGIIDEAFKQALSQTRTEELERVVKLMEEAKKEVPPRKESLKGNPMTKIESIKRRNTNRTLSDLIKKVKEDC